MCQLRDREFVVCEDVDVGTSIILSGLLLLSDTSFGLARHYELEPRFIAPFSMYFVHSQQQRPIDREYFELANSTYIH